jgi:hypothetical protein
MAGDGVIPAAPVPEALLVAPDQPESPAFAVAGARAPRSPFWAEHTDGVFVQLREAGPWQRVSLAGVDLPGFCAVRSAKIRKVLTVAGPKADAEELIDTGAEASEVSIVCYMWIPAHLAAYEELVDVLEMRGGTRADPRPVDLVHPGLNLVGIGSVYVTLITPPEPSSLPGVYETTIHASEFKPKQNRPKEKATLAPLTASASSVRVAPEFQTPTPDQTQGDP